MRKTNDIFEKRLAKHMDELRWLYMELYDNEAMFAELCEPDAELPIMQEIRNFEREIWRRKRIRRGIEKKTCWE